MPLDEESIAQVQQLIAQKFDLLSAFRGMDVRDLEQIGQDLEQFIYGRQQTLRKPRNTYTPRITVAGNDINLDQNAVGKGHAGPTLPRWIDFVGATGYLDKTDPQIAHIQTAGGGADCLFDMLISQCFASLAGFTEGKVFTSLSGCTFKGYSTVAGAVAQANTDFPALSGLTPTIAICSGTYTETNITIGSQCSQRWLGTGRDRTLITSGGAASIATPTVKFTLAGVLSLEGLTISAATHSTSTGAGVLLSVASSTLDAFNCTFEGGSTTNTSRAGIYAPDSLQGKFVHLLHCNFPTRIGCWMQLNDGEQEIINCRFTGGNIGLGASENCRINGNYFNTPVGIQITTVQNIMTIENNKFDVCSTAGIQLTNSNNKQQGIWIRNNTFNQCELDYDFSIIDTSIFVAGSYSIQIYGNASISPATAHIKWPAINVWYAALIHDEMLTRGATFETGIVPYHVKKFHNFAGTLEVNSTMYGNGVLGIVAPDNNTGVGTLYWDAFYVFFGDTRVSVAAGSFLYTSNNTWYVSVNNAGVVTANTLGAFPAGEFPIAIVTTAGAAHYITTIDYYDGFLRTTATGVSAAPSNEPYVTIGNTAGLSAERALAAGANISIVDGGPGSTVTISATGVVTAEHHVVSAQVDVTVASTTVPYQMIGPMTSAGTITGVEAKAGENKTNGATSAIFDVHKVLAANANTDGQGTTIFTTQGNRPTISNGNMLSTTTAPDVTTFAAGDYLAVYVDQSGTSLTVANVGIRFTIP